jgi:rare lipoprotein A
MQRRIATLSCTALLLLSGCHKSRVHDPGYSTAGSAPELDGDAGSQAKSLGRPVSSESGLASWYGPPYHHRQAADGSIFDQNALTAAHRTLPLGTIVRVTSVASGESVIVKITDRGPFVRGRILDLSLAAAKAIGVYRAGVAQVRIEVYAHATSDPQGHWCVQIGAFPDQDEAIQLKNDLKLRYQTARVIEFAGPTGHWVRINPADPNRATSARIAESIHVPDAEPYLVRTD